MPQFCDDETTTYEQCAVCPHVDTQHPCWAAKVSYWQTEGPLQLAKSAVPSRWRAAAGRREWREGEVTTAPAGASEGSRALDHAIPTDERGLPYLGADLEPLTRKEMSVRRADIAETLRGRASRDSRR